MQYSKNIFIFYESMKLAQKPFIIIGLCLGAAFAQDIPSESEPAPIETEKNSTLIVQRKKAYQGALRKIKIILDSVEIGSLGNGESKEFTISDGYHKIYIKGGGTFFASDEITFNVSSGKIIFLIGYTGFGLDIVEKTQEEYDKKTVKPLGITLSITHPDIYEKSDTGVISRSITLFAFEFGLTYDIFNSDLFNLQPGIMFNLKRARYERKNLFSEVGGYWDDNGVRPNTVDLGLYYIEFPVLLTCKLSPFRFDAGPYISMLVGGSAEYDSGNHTNAKKLYKTLDYGFRVRLGIDVDIDYYWVMFYDYGIADVSKVNGFTVNNRTFGFTFVYRL